MKKVLLVTALLGVFTLPAHAEDTDLCKALVKQAEAGLKANQLHDVVRDRLREMLNVGRKGNFLTCLSVANGSLAAPKAENTCTEKPAV